MLCKGKFKKQNQNSGSSYNQHVIKVGSKFEVLLDQKSISEDDMLSMVSKTGIRQVRFFKFWHLGERTIKLHMDPFPNLFIQKEIFV